MLAVEFLIGIVVGAGGMASAASVNRFRIERAPFVESELGVRPVSR